MMKTLLLAIVLASAAGAAQGADQRIREIGYDPASVTRLRGCLGFQTMIEFAPDERIENVGLGDAARWLVTPNARANLLFVRPAEATAHSNLTVATSKRRYAFDLFAAPSQDCAEGRVIYYLRFRYDDLPQQQNEAAPGKSGKPAEPEIKNNAYTYKGARENVPYRIFDNGKSTFFRWADGAAAPAVYVVTSDGGEALASLASRGDYLVVDQIAPRFLLRHGKQVTTMFNDGYSAPQLDAVSPQPRQKRDRDGGTAAVQRK